MATTISIDINAYRLCHADSVAYLYEHLVCHTCSHHVLGYITSGISSRTVYLAAVLTREGSSTMSTFASIGINDNFTTGKTSITMRTTYHELACRIDIILDVIIKQGQHLFTQLLLDTRNQDIDHVLSDFCQHSLIIIVTISIFNKVIMLS